MEHQPGAERVIRADKVISWSKLCWDVSGPLQGCFYDGSAPTGTCERRRGHALLVNLEPVVSLPGTGAEACTTVVHPNHYWALLMRPLSPKSSDVLASSDGGSQSSARSTVASHGRVGDRENGAIAGPLPLNGWGASSGRASSMTLKLISADKSKKVDRKSYPR